MTTETKLITVRTHLLYIVVIGILALALPYAKKGYDQSVLERAYPNGAVPVLAPEVAEELVK